MGYGNETEDETYHVIVITAESGFLLEREQKGFGSFPWNQIFGSSTSRDTISVGDPGSAGRLCQLLDLAIPGEGYG